MAKAVEKKLGNVTIRNAEIAFRNFAGREGQYNREGDRNFCVLLPDDTADEMKADGWNIKYLKPREEGDSPKPYLKVKVKLDSFRPPVIYLVTKKNKTRLPEEMVDILDWADIDYCDMILNPYSWNVNGGSGITAYLTQIYVNITENELEEKYSEIPDSTQNTMLAIEGESRDLEDDIIDAEIVEDDQLAIGR